MTPIRKNNLSFFNALRFSFLDAIAGCRNWQKWFALARVDLKKRYSRTTIGSFWASASFFLTIVILGSFYAFVFHRDPPVYIPHFSSGLLCWLFIQAMVTEGGNTFIKYESFVKEFNLPLSTYVLACVWKNFQLMSFQFLVLAALDIFWLQKFSWATLSVIPAAAIFLLNGFFVSLLFATIVTRFRDIAQLLGNIMRVAFFVTPILWMPDFRPGLKEFVIFNPAYHFIELIRVPVYGMVAPLLNWAVALGMTFLLGLISFIVFGKYYMRIRYWI